MKSKLTKLFFLFLFSILITSCKKEIIKESDNEDRSCYPNSERPIQAISYQEMAAMFKEYDNGPRNVLNDYRTKITKGKDSVATISMFFKLSELKQYIAYIERLSEEKEIDLTGVRIFTSAYPSDYEKKELQSRITYMLAPTTNIGDAKNIAYEPLKSGVKNPVSMKSILDKYADETTKNVNRASFLPFNMRQSDRSSALNRGNNHPPY